MFADIGFECEICGVINRYMNEDRLYKLMDSNGKEIPVQRIKCRAKKCKAFYDITCYDHHVDLQYVPRAERAASFSPNGIPREQPWHPNCVNEFLARKLSVRGDKKFLKKQGILRTLNNSPNGEDILYYILSLPFQSNDPEIFVIGMMHYHEFMRYFVETLHLIGVD